MRVVELVLFLIHFFRSYARWFLVNFVLGLMPVLVIWFVDNFDYSDAVFLSMTSFSFTMLIASYYSGDAWESSSEVSFPRILTFAFLLSLLFLCGLYHYATRYGPIEGTPAQLVSHYKLTIMLFMFAITFGLSTFLNWPNIAQHAIKKNQAQKAKEDKKSKKDYEKYNNELDKL